ncbi:phage tail family protein, partial [Bacillus cereus]|nr:phage tail family protein [Bacillus cereus]
MSSFTFNNIRKDCIQIEKGWKKPAWAPLKRNFLSVPGYPGARLLTTETKMRVLPVPVGIIVPDGSDLETVKEEIAEWLITEKPVELVFDVTPDRTYLAVIDEDFDPEDFVTLGKGILNFVCPMPYKLGNEKTVDFENEGRGLIANVQNKGSVHSNPIIEIDIKKPHTFLDVWFEDKYEKEPDYFRIGMPLKMEQLPVERNQRLIWDEMSTTVGWSKVSSMEDGNPVGEMKTDSYQFYCSDYGSGNGWHGAAVKKSIPGGPVQDFIMQAHVTCKSKKINEMGRVEIAILDENSKVLSKIAMNDLYWQAEQNFGTMVIGYDNKPGKTGLIYESGDYPNTWNQY